MLRRSPMRGRPRFRRHLDGNALRCAQFAIALSKACDTLIWRLRFLRVSSSFPCCLKRRSRNCVPSFGSAPHYGSLRAAPRTLLPVGSNGNVRLTRAGPFAQAAATRSVVVSTLASTGIPLCSCCASFPWWCFWRAGRAHPPKEGLGSAVLKTGTHRSQFRPRNAVPAPGHRWLAVLICPLLRSAI